MTQLIPRLAGHISLAQFRMLAQILVPLSLPLDLAALSGSSSPCRRGSTCPLLCRPAVAMAFLTDAASVPRPKRLDQLAEYLAALGPRPASSQDLSGVIGLAWPGEALKLLWVLARAGILTAIKERGRVEFFLQAQ